MAAFNYAVKVEDENGFSEKYFTVIAWGTKKRMMEWAKHFDADPRTVESRITREKDGKVVHSYTR
jgi:hypothetical protein